MKVLLVTNHGFLIAVCVGQKHMMCIQAKQSKNSHVGEKTTLEVLSQVNISFRNFKKIKILVLSLSDKDLGPFI